MLVRCDIGGATHEFIADCREAGVRFSVGYAIDDGPTPCDPGPQKRTGSRRWRPMVPVRDGAWVTELTEHLDLSAWPEGTRVIARRERPHPGASSRCSTRTATDISCSSPTRTATDIAALELRHRHRAHVENRIRAAKDTGMRNLPYDDIECNETWLQLVLIAQDLLGLVAATLLARCTRRRRTQTAAPPCAPRRRQGRPPQPPDPTQARPRLALVHRSRCRVHTTAVDPRALLIASSPLTTTIADPRGWRLPETAAQPRPDRPLPPTNGTQLPTSSPTPTFTRARTRRIHHRRDNGGSTVNRTR